MLSAYLAKPGEMAPNSAIKKRTSRRKSKELAQVHNGRVGKEPLPRLLRSRQLSRQYSQKTRKEAVGWWNTQKDVMRVFTISDPPAGSRLGGVEESPSGRWVYVHADPPEALKPIALTRILDNPGKKRRQAFSAGYSVGGSKKSDIRPACPYVERHQCVIYHKLNTKLSEMAQAFFVRDESTSGTWVNGVKLTPDVDQELKDGDVIQFAPRGTKGAVKLIIRIPHIKLISNIDVGQLYEFQETLGDGQCGVVKRVKCKKTKKLFACKMIRSAQSYITANRYRETLLQEISVYMALKPHPCVTQVKEVVEQDFKIYVFMELLEGGDLHEYVRLADPPMTEDEVRIIFDQLFHATYFLHKSNLVHRDIKLENVLMADKEKLFVKIVDLGLAKFMPDNNDCFATICGTQLYAAPELLRGHGSTQPRFTNKVDIWCLGMMLYICLTGRHPFLDTYEKYTPPETLRCIEENPVDCTEEGFEYVSKEGIDLVKRLLAMDPDERPTIAEVLRHPWLDQIESPRTQVKGLARCPSLVEYLKENPIKETEDGS